MNPINVVPKTVTVVPARTAEVSAVTWVTMDDPFNRRLRVQVNNNLVIAVEGDAYDALGQWTDTSLQALIMARLDLTPA